MIPCHRCNYYGHITGADEIWCDLMGRKIRPGHYQDCPGFAVREVPKEEEDDGRVAEFLGNGEDDPRRTRRDTKDQGREKREELREDGETEPQMDADERGFGLSGEKTKCRSCLHDFILFRKFGEDPPEPICPECFKRFRPARESIGVNRRESADDNPGEAEWEKEQAANAVREKVILELTGKGWLILHPPAVRDIVEALQMTKKLLLIFIGKGYADHVVRD